MIHLSNEEISLYCDKEVSPEQTSKVSEHIEICTKCRNTLEENRKFSKMLNASSENKLNLVQKGDCLNDVQISEYCEGKISSDTQRCIEEHLSNCDYCLDILIETKDCLKKTIAENIGFLEKEKVFLVVKKTLRENKSNQIIKTFDSVVKNAPYQLQKALKEISSNFKAMLKNTFTYPAPCFPPVFGKAQVNVFSPFGKVGYPVIFKWIPYEGADSYEISIEEANWSVVTHKAKFIIERDKVKLRYGEEYTWELKVLKSGKILDEISGFFSLSAKEEVKQIKEIESQIEKIEPEADRLILLGGILEEKELYIEAIETYKKIYAIEPSAGIAYRIANCYDKLELEDLRDEWNNKVREFGG